MIAASTTASTSPLISESRRVRAIQKIKIADALSVSARNANHRFVANAADRALSTRYAASSKSMRVRGNWQIARNARSPAMTAVR